MNRHGLVQGTLALALGSVASCCLAGCAGDLLNAEHVPRLPATVSVEHAPVRLMAGQPAQLAVVADVASPHGPVVYRWDLGGLGIRQTSQAARTPQAAWAVHRGSATGADGTDRVIDIDVAALPAGTTEQTFDCGVTVEVTWNGVVESHSYRFMETVYRK